MGTTTNKIQIEKILLSLSAMTKMVIKNHEQANKCIRENDKKLAIKVLNNDKQIDHEFFAIQSEIEFMITKALVAKNLRRVIASLHTVAHLERIGDYAKKIAKFVIKNELVSASSIRRITKVQNKFQQMIKHVPTIIANEDLNQAKKVWKDDDQVDLAVEEIREELVASISNKSSKVAITERVFVLNIVNSFERAADHITSICELIYYIETGQHFNLV